MLDYHILCVMVMSGVYVEDCDVAECLFLHIRMVHLCRHGLNCVPIDHSQGKSLIDPSRSTSHNVCEGSDLARSNEGSVNSNGRLKRGTGAVTEIINRNRGVLDLRERRSVIRRVLSHSQRWASDCAAPA